MLTYPLPLHRQACLKVMAAGPLRAIELATEDFPPAAVRLAQVSYSAYAHVCSCMLTYAEVCCRMLTSADDC